MSSRSELSPPTMKNVSWASVASSSKPVRFLIAFTFTRLYRLVNLNDYIFPKLCPRVYMWVNNLWSTSDFGQRWLHFELWGKVPEKINGRYPVETRCVLLQCSRAKKWFSYIIGQWSLWARQCIRSKWSTDVSQRHTTMTSNFGLLESCRSISRMRMAKRLHPSMVRCVFYAKR